MAPETLDDAVIQERLQQLAGWERAGRAIRKVYLFPSFPRAVEFVNRVAALAEELDHHPDVLIQYDTVTLTLSSHDAGGLTARDFRLAARIDG